MSHTHPYCKVIYLTGILITMFGFLFLSFPHIFCLLQLFGVYKIFLMSANVLCPKKNGKHFVSEKRIYKPSFVKKKQNLRVVSERSERAASRSENKHTQVNIHRIDEPQGISCCRILCLKHLKRSNLCRNSIYITSKLKIFEIWVYMFVHLFQMVFLPMVCSSHGFHTYLKITQ